VGRQGEAQRRKMNHIVKITDAEYITHDVKRFVFEKPAGFEFIPGQAADVFHHLPNGRTSCGRLPLPVLRKGITWNS
jgi:ferredoxin-NADP reductase